MTRYVILLISFGWLGTATILALETDETAFPKARESAKIAGYGLSKVQRWLHEVALTKIDPKTKLYISQETYTGEQLHQELHVVLQPGEEAWLQIDKISKKLHSAGVK